MKKDAALLIVDVQNDFCPGGTLPVPDGDRVIEPLSRAAGCFAAAGMPVCASRDWHPPVTRHFTRFGGSWPPHCVQNSLGAAFHPDLRLPMGTLVISKGSDPESDSYSAFDGRSADGKSLAELLSALDVRHLYIGGLASDYCVRSSVLDARKAGFEVTVLSDAIAGVDVSAGDTEKALEEMARAGADFCPTDEATRRIAERHGI
jgi:nicotinamidase/pyrazinamidase